MNIGCEEIKIVEPKEPMDGDGISVGQMLYRGRCNRIHSKCSINKYVVIAKDESNRLLIIDCNDFDLDYSPLPWIAEKDEGLVADIKVALQQAIDVAEDCVERMRSSMNEITSKVMDGKSTL